MISKKGVYGLSAMYVLALNLNDDLMQSKDIASKANIPHNFLEQILIVLKKANLVKSIRGNKGGYKLFKSAEKISVYDILNSLESCISCIPEEQEEQLLFSFWQESQNKMKNIFDLSLHDLVLQNKRSIIFSI